MSYTDFTLIKIHRKEDFFPHPNIRDSQVCWSWVELLFQKPQYCVVFVYVLSPYIFMAK